MLGDEVHDALAPEVELAVLLAAAEDRLALPGGEAEFIGPAGLAGEGQLRAAVTGGDADLQRMPAAGEGHGVLGPGDGRQRDPLGLGNGFLHAAMAGGVGFFPPEGCGEGPVSQMGQERGGVVGQGPTFVLQVGMEHEGSPFGKEKKACQSLKNVKNDSPTQRFVRRGDPV